MNANTSSNASNSLFSFLPMADYHVTVQSVPEGFLLRSSHTETGDELASTLIKCSAATKEAIQSGNTVDAFDKLVSDFLYLNELNMWSVEGVTAH